MSVFLSLFLLFSSFPVKANEVTFPSFPAPVEGKSSTHYIIIYQEYNPGYEEYVLIMPLDPNSIYFLKRSSEDILKYGGPAITYTWKEGTNSWKKYIESDVGSQRGICKEYETILYSSFDLYYEDGSIFFPKAPIKVTFLDQMKKTQMGAVMTTIVSLIPLLIVLLVSLIAFRKAWAWLSKVLRTA